MPLAISTSDGTPPLGFCVCVTGNSSDLMAKLQASEARRADPGVVLAAVRQDGLALEHAAWALRNDPAVCRAAVEASGGALERCTPTVRADRAVVLAAVRQVRRGGARAGGDKEQGAGATAPLDGSATATLV